MAIVELNKLTRIYTSGEHELRALDGVGVLSYLLKALASEYELKLIMGWRTFVISIVMTFAVSMVVGLMIAGKNRKIDMVEALKGTD